MKKFTMLNLLAGLILMAQVSEAAAIYNVENIVNGKKYQVTSNEIKGENLDISYTFKKDMLVLKIKNNGDELVNIDWNEAKYIGLDGKESRAYDFKQKDRGWFETLTPAGIRPGDYYEAFLVPSSNLKSVPSSGVTGGVIYVSNDLFDPKSPEMKNRKNDYAQLIIPVVIGKPHSGKSSDILITLGDKDSVTLKPATKTKVIPMAPISNTPVEGAIPTPVSKETEVQLQKVQEDNAKLQAEIKAREQLMNYLKEQEALKKQLADKDAEIQKLLKNLNQ